MTPMPSLDPQRPLHPLPLAGSHSPLQHPEALASETLASETPASETHPFDPDILRPMPFRPDDSALRPNAPSGSELRLWFANLSQGTQVLTLLVAGLFLIALLGVVFQLLAFVIRLLMFGLMAVLVLRFVARPTPE